MNVNDILFSMLVFDAAALLALGIGSAATFALVLSSLGGGGLLWIAGYMFGG